MRKFVIPKSPYEKIKYNLHNNRSMYSAFADSHGANALHSNEEIVNLSFRGDNLKTIMMKVKLYTQRHKPKGIIIQADPHQFASYRIMADQSGLQADLAEPAEPIFTSLRPVYRQYLIEYWKESAKRIVWNNQIEKPSTVTKIRRLTEAKNSKIQADTQRRVQLHSPLPEFRKLQEAKIFKQLIAELTAQGIKVCMVTFPVSSNYREEMARIPLYAKVLSYFKRLAHDSNAYYVDFSRSMTDSYFSDPDHLNSDGASLFTQNVLNSCFRRTS